MGVADYARLDEMLADAELGHRPCYTANGARFLKTPRVLTTPPFSAYVKISDGCDNRCAYCAIPLIRGGYSSRPFDDIVAECRRLAKDGVTELTLIAQDTSRYGCDFGDGHYLLPELLEAVSAIDGVPLGARIVLLPRLHRRPAARRHRQPSEGRALPRPAASAHRRRPAQAHEPPRQRGLDQEPHRRVRKRGILVRTTMIVGFPGETDAQFQTLLDFVREAKFERLGAFTYSAEEGTPAARMPDQIPEETKNARLDQLMMLQQAISMDFNESRVGTTCEVLVEGFDEGNRTVLRPLDSGSARERRLHLARGRGLRPRRIRLRRDHRRGGLRPDRPPCLRRKGDWNFSPNNAHPTPAPTPHPTSRPALRRP